MLLHPERFHDYAILEALEYAQLDGVGQSYLKRLRSQLHPPKLFRPFDATHWPSYEFLIKEGLLQIFHPDVHGKRAFQMLQMPRVKEFLEVLTLSNAPPGPMAEQITKQYNFECSRQDVVMYRHFFWDLSVVDTTEAKALIYLRFHSTRVRDNWDSGAHSTAMEKLYWSDARKIAAELPTSPFSAMSAQLKMGVTPAHLDVAKMLQVSWNIVALKVAETAAGEGPRNAENLTHYVQALKQLREVMVDMAPPEEDLNKQLTKIGLATDDRPLITVQELTGGAVTAQLLPDKLLSGEGREPSAEDVEDGGLP